MQAAWLAAALGKTGFSLEQDHSRRICLWSTHTSPQVCPPLSCLFHGSSVGTRCSSPPTPGCKPLWRGGCAEGYCTSKSQVSAGAGGLQVSTHCTRQHHCCIALGCPSLPFSPALVPLVIMWKVHSVVHSSYSFLVDWEHLWPPSRLLLWQCCSLEARACCASALEQGARVGAGSFPSGMLRCGFSV